MTLTVRCQQAFSDTTKPVVRNDSVLTAGSLLLIDPAHPAMPWVNGIPADASLVPNVAINEAKAAISGLTDTEAKPTFYKPAAFTGAAGLIERTTKGGVHGIPSQVNAISDSGPQILFPLKVIQYLLNNPRHSYYISSWSRFTRGFPSGPADSMPVVFSIAGAVGSDNGKITLASAGVLSGSTTTVLYRPNGSAAFVASSPIASIQTATPNRHSVATADWFNPRGTYPSPMPGDGTNNTLNGASAGGQIGWGEIQRLGTINPAGATFTGQNTNSMSTGNAHNKMPSMILYRFYLEDLTVSGRSFAAVDAIDAAQFTAAFNASTGRYGSDTYTNPTTLP